MLLLRLLLHLHLLSSAVQAAKEQARVAARRRAELGGRQERRLLLRLLRRAVRGWGACRKRCARHHRHSGPHLLEAAAAKHARGRLLVERRGRHKPSVAVRRLRRDHTVPTAVSIRDGLNGLRLPNLNDLAARGVVISRPAPPATPDVLPSSIAVTIAVASGREALDKPIFLGERATLGA